MSKRVEQIRQALMDAYQPTSLNVIDDSHLHAGHSSAEGKGHFTDEIVSAAFDGKSLLQRHKMIYATLADLMESDIHALSIKASAPTS